MKFNEAKEKYIESWGSLATMWGISRTMAQIHALLLISPKPLSSEEIQQELKISSGNTNQNIRELINWGIVEKKLIAGERREFFIAKKEIWEVFKQIAKERKKREIEPVMSLLLELQKVEDKTAEAKEFKKVITEISEVTHTASDTLDLILKSDYTWIMTKIVGLFKKK